MDAAVLRRFGEAPQLEDFPAPVPEDGEKLVRVHAAPLTSLSRWMTIDRDYSRSWELPFICGVDGVGSLEDGSRVAFGALRSPYGTMAEYAIAPPEACFPVTENVDDAVAAALINSGISIFNALDWGAGLTSGETVLVLGATGVTGKVAVQVAKLLGAGRVVAAGRDEQALSALPELGADDVIQLDQPDDRLAKDFVRAGGYDIVLDYVWGRPAQVLLESTPRGLMAGSDIRYLQLGNDAGMDISLPASAIRRTGVVLRAAPISPAEQWRDYYATALAHAAKGALHIDVEPVPLADVAKLWPPGTSRKRLVFVPRN